MEKKRINIELSMQAYDVLRELAEVRGVSMTDVIRDGLASQRWLQGVFSDSSQKLLIRQGKELREVFAVGSLSAGTVSPTPASDILTAKSEG